MLNVQCNTIHAVLPYYPYPLTPLLFSTPLARNCQFMLICFQYSTNFIFTSYSIHLCVSEFHLPLHNFGRFVTVCDRLLSLCYC